MNTIQDWFKKVKDDWISPHISPIRALIFSILLSLCALFFIPAVISDVDKSHKTPGYPSNETGVALLSYIFNFDWTNTQKVTLLWSICGQGGLRPLGDEAPPGACLPVNRAVDVYFNNVTDPVFSFDPDIIPTNVGGGPFFSSELFSFFMDHTIYFSNTYDAPFDTYRFSGFAFVIDKATNKSIPVKWFGFANGGPGDISTDAISTVTNSPFTYDDGSGPATHQIVSYGLMSTITRSRTAKALTISMFAINWLLTLCAIIAASALWGKSGEKVSDGVAILPITVILTIPAIRALFVGSPRVGIFYDVVGFFPQMLTVVVCATAVLCNVVLHARDGKTIPNP